MKPNFVKHDTQNENTTSGSNFNMGQAPQIHEPKLVSAFISKFLNDKFIEKIVNVSLYQVDHKTVSKSGKTATTTNVIRKFVIDSFRDIERMKSISLDFPTSTVKIWLQFAKKVIDLKSDASSRLLNYDNLDVHFNNANKMHLTKMIQNIKNNRITNIEEFRELHEDVLETIQVANELRKASGTLYEIDELVNTINNSDQPLIDIAKTYKEVVLNAYSEISQFNVINKASSLSDYILISDENSIKNIAKDLATYLATGYSFYKSGFDIIDSTIGGIESSNVHIICGPTNNAKSIFMINLAWQMILNNIQEFEEGDTFIFLTLEDDIYKLTRRFISIFGNYSTPAIKHLFVKSSNLFKRQKNKDINENDALYNSVCKLLEQLMCEAILKTTGKRINFILKHSRETTTPRDLVKFMDARKTEGFTPRAVFIDYLDIMVPSDARYTNFNDYDNHGVITQELRNVAGEYGVPIITITQGKRDSESTAAMSNTDIGDSYKKARYSDYIYMVRLRYDLNLLTECVREHVLPKDSDDANNLADINNPNSKDLVPFEIKITKAKDGGKNLLQYHLFSGANLRIYEMLQNFYNDIPHMQAQSQALANDVDLLNINSMQAMPGNVDNELKL